MKKLLSLLLIAFHLYIPIEAQVQTFILGASAQLSWVWRPDLGNNFYEFTYTSYTPAASTTHIHSSRVNLYCWNDCNYGKAYMGATDTGFVNEPLHDTLFRTVSQYGIIDTFCGFDAPYKKAFPLSSTEKSLSTSPHRKKLEYKGIVSLPEKCDQWHFTIGAYKYVCGDASDKAAIFANKMILNDTFSLSNIHYDALYPYYGILKPQSLANSVVGCSFNNIDFPDNSSVRFLSSPIYYYQIGKNVEYNPGPFDPDHDSIVITLHDTIKGTNWLSQWSSGVWKFFKIYDSSGSPHQEVFTGNHYFAPLPGQSGPNPIRYNAVNNPFDTDSTFHIVGNTGKTTFNAQSVMYPVLYYSAKDYRNNRLISESFFYTQFTLIDDPRPTSCIKVDTNNVQGILSFNNQGAFMGCAGYPISFDAHVKLPGVTNGNLIVRTTADTTLPGNGNCVFSNMNTDSVHLNFNWTPPANARGLYNVYVSAKDSNCDPPYNHYTQVYTWSFFIDSCVISSIVSPIVKEEGNVVLYPNPANDMLMISSDEDFGSVKIYSLLSQLLYEKKTAGTRRSEVSIKDFPTGMYLVNIDGKYIRKLLIVR